MFFSTSRPVCEYPNKPTMTLDWCKPFLKAKDRVFELSAIWTMHINGMYYSQKDTVRIVVGDSTVYITSALYKTTEKWSLKWILRHPSLIPFIQKLCFKVWNIQRASGAKPHFTLSLNTKDIRGTLWDMYLCRDSARKLAWCGQNLIIR